MRVLINFIIIAILLYAIIAIIAWDIKWITFHWFARAMYLIVAIAFTMVFSNKQS